MIKSELCDKWKIETSGVADDQCFARNGSSMGSIAEEFHNNGIYFQPAHKGDRIAGWNKMRRLLSDATTNLDRPEMYVSRSCELFWATVPYLPRDVKRIEDVDSTANDHSADAARYSILAPVYASNLQVQWSS